MNDGSNECLCWLVYTHFVFRILHRTSMEHTKNTDSVYIDFFYSSDDTVNEAVDDERCCEFVELGL